MWAAADSPVDVLTFWKSLYLTISMATFSERGATPLPLKSVSSVPCVSVMTDCLFVTAEGKQLILTLLPPLWQPLPLLLMWWLLLRVLRPLLLVATLQAVLE